MIKNNLTECVLRDIMFNILIKKFTLQNYLYLILNVVLRERTLYLILY